MFILKQLRHKKNVSQTDLAVAVGVSLRTIQLYEKKGANIPIKNLTKIAQYFDVSIAELYSQEKVNDIGVAYDIKDSKFKKGHIIHKLGPGKYLISVPLIVSKQYEKYIKKFPDQLFIDALPRIGFVIEQVSVGHYMAFEIANASMDVGTIESIPDKAIILGKLIPASKFVATLKSNPDLAWIIVHKDDIMCKKIVGYDKKTKTLQCHSLNNSPEYPDFEISIGEVEQFFMVIKKQVN